MTVENRDNFADHLLPAGNAKGTMYILWGWNENKSISERPYSSLHCRSTDTQTHRQTDGQTDLIHRGHINTNVAA